IFLICLRAGLGFFDKFNFIWPVVAFVIAVSLCYPDSVKNLWVSSSRFARWAAVILFGIVLGATLYVIFAVLHFHFTGLHTINPQGKWHGLLGTLSGVAVANLIFGDNSWVMPFVPFWLIVTDCYLALACLFFLLPNAEAGKNRKNGFFFLLIGFLVFLQIVITPQAGGPHHYSMIFPLPLLVFVFLARSLYTQLASKNLRRLAALLVGVAAVFVFAVNVHNTAVYLSHFRANSHYSPRWP